MSSNFTLFQSDQSSSTNGNAFDQDAFQDITLAATNNTGFSSTLSSNPLNYNFANDDSVRFGAKTLYIKDLVLVQDRALWINGKPTYQIIWNENYPEAQGYIFGNIQLTKGQYVSIRQAGDGIGITGVLRKCAFLVTGDTAATATAQLAVDGVNGSTITFSSAANPLNDQTGAVLKESKYAAFVNATSNQTKDIHDYRLTAIQTTTLRIVGVVIYSENSGANIDVFPGITYNNKTRVVTTTGATLPLPAYTGQLGGRALYYKNQNGGYTNAIQPAPNLQSIATGSTGTNLVNVTTGTGASFPIGSGIAAFWGSTGFVGSVTNQSTDTLTVSPTLPFGISGLIYKTWYAGQSLAINSSQMLLANTFDVNLITGFSNFATEPTGQYRVWGSGIGYTSIIDSIWPGIVATNVTTGFLQVDGYFSAADIEFVGQGVLHATLSVNGYPAFGVNVGQTGCVKKTIFTDAGPQWNSFNLTWGPSHSVVAVNRINLYQRQLPQGVSFGLLALMDTLPAYVNPTAVNATYVALGTFKRYYADQILFTGGWDRQLSSLAAGGVQYSGYSTNAAIKFNYYGKNFAVLGLQAGQSMALSLDGGAAAGFNFNVMQSVATEGFHTVAVSNGAGSSNFVWAIDVCRTQGEIKNLQNLSALPLNSQAVLRHELFATGTAGTNGYGSAAGCVAIVFATLVDNTGTAITRKNDTVNGDTFTINEDGLYYVGLSVSRAAGGENFGISKNFGDITVSIINIPLSDRLFVSFSVTANLPEFASAVTFLRAGDVLRAVAEGNALAAGNATASIRITKVGN